MVADGKPVMLVLSAAEKVNSKAFKKKFGIKDLKMATEKQVEQATGVKVGAVPPFGNLFKLETYADRGLSENKEIVFSAGLHTKSIKMGYQDWFKLVKPKSTHFSE